MIVWEGFMPVGSSGSKKTGTELSWWEVLDEECRELARPSLKPLQSRAAYVTERKRCAESGLDPATDPQLQAAKAAFRKDVIARLRAILQDLASDSKPLLIRNQAK